MSESVEILPPLQRVACSWRARAGRPADAQAAIFEALLETLVHTGDATAATDLLRCAAADPRLLGDAAQAVMTWLNGGGHVHDDPFLRLELVRMQSTHRRALEERGTPPRPAMLADVTGDPVAERLRQALKPFSEDVREAWLMRRKRCEQLPGWRHYDLLLEMRPGALLGKADVPGHVAATIRQVRDEISRIWLDDATVAVHAYPVHVGNGLLNHMRGRAMPLLHDETRVATATGPVLRDTIVTPPDDDLVLAGTRRDPGAASETETDAAPRLRGSLPEAACGDIVVRRDGGNTPARRETGLSSLLPPAVVESWHNFTHNRPLMLGFALLPALLGWHMLTSNGETRARIAALEEARQELLQTRAWRSEAGASAEDPLITVAAYRDALGALDATPSLPIYSQETRRFLLGRFRSRAGMQREWSDLATCGTPRVQISGDRAVVSHRPRRAACAPFFLRMEGGRWRLDMQTRVAAVAEDAEGFWQWRHGRPPDDYAFAFRPLIAGYEPGP